MPTPAPPKLAPPKPVVPKRRIPSPHSHTLDIGGAIGTPPRTASPRGSTSAGPPSAKAPAHPIADPLSIAARSARGKKPPPFNTLAQFERYLRQVEVQASREMEASLEHLDAGEEERLAKRVETSRKEFNKVHDQVRERQRQIRVLRDEHVRLTDLKDARAEEEEGEIKVVHSFIHPQGGAVVSCDFGGRDELAGDIVEVGELIRDEYTLLKQLVFMETRMEVNLEEQDKETARQHNRLAALKRDKVCATQILTHWRGQLDVVQGQMRSLEAAAAQAHVRRRMKLEQLARVADDHEETRRAQERLEAEDQMTVEAKMQHMAEEAEAKAQENAGELVDTIEGRLINEFSRISANSATMHFDKHFKTIRQATGIWDLDSKPYVALERVGRSEGVVVSC